MATSTLEATTVLITGAAGGLGKAIATAYLGAGANVTICDVNSDRLDATRAEFEQSFPGKILAVKTDITDEKAVEALVQEAVEKFGRLDILVNNAGVMDRFDPVGELEKSEWDRVMSINLTGSFLCAKVAVNAFKKQQAQNQPQQPEAGAGGQQQQQQQPKEKKKMGGLIIQIGSNASYMGKVSGLAYTVSKHGVAAIVKHTAGYYGEEGIYAVGLMLGGMPATNIAEGMMRGQLNVGAYGRINGIQGFDVEEHAIDLEDVGRYCVFLSRGSVAKGANGSCITFNSNWPNA